MLDNLKKEIVTFIISITLSISIIIASNHYWKNLYYQKEDAVINLNQTKKIYYNALEKNNLLKLFENKYEHLKKIGIVGKESRLDWVNSLDNISNTYKIPYLKYKIKKQQHVVSDNIMLNYPDIDLLKSTMSLEMQLLHEGDLYTVINNLRSKTSGLFDVSHCAIIRNETQIKSLLNSTTDKNFSASCTLNWYTIKEKNSTSTDDLLNKGSS